MQNKIDVECSSYTRAISRSKLSILIALAAILSVVAGAQAGIAAPDQAAADVNTAFQVNVVESLTISVTKPSSWASGSINTFLRNDIGLSVATNNNSGFTASMYSKNNTTNLTNTTSGNSEILPTLGSSSTRSSFPANYWGYSLGQYTLDGNIQTSYTLNNQSYGETQEGSGSSNYYPLVSTSATPITVMDGTNKRTGSQNIYFGAKGNASLASGTYAGTVVISVITGNVDPSTNPITPTNPATDLNTNPPASNPSYAYDSTNNRTVYTQTGTDGTGANKVTTTQVSDGDTTDSYSGPKGVLEQSYSSVSDATPIATGLALTAAVAATSGYMFFIIANRREREEEEEEEEEFQP